MRIVVSGAAGFIGNALMNSLCRDGHQVMGIVHRRQPKADGTGALFLATTDNDFANAIKRFDPECFIHSANHYSREANWTSPPDMTDAIINIGLRIVSSLQKPGVHIINLATYFQRSAGVPRTPNSLYAVLKQNFSDLLDFFAHEKEMLITELYLFDTYGPGDTRGKVLDQMVTAHKRNRHLQLLVESQEVNLVHVSDIVEAVRLVILARTIGDFSVASPTNHTLIEVDQIIERLSGKKSPITYLGKPAINLPRPDHVAPRLPGFTTKVPLESGIQELWENWFQIT